MSRKKIIVCLDVDHTNATKGVKYQNTMVVGDPYVMAGKYTLSSADALIMRDINASKVGRTVLNDLVETIAKVVVIPFIVGGGLKSIEDIQEVLNAGADKVLINSQAIEEPIFIKNAVDIFGSTKVLVAIDVRPDKDMPSGYGVYKNSGTVKANLDAVEWAKKMEEYGTSTLLVTAIEMDGTRNGYDLELTKKISNAVSIQVIASGGAGEPKHVEQVLTEGNAYGAVVATILHHGNFTVSDIKEHLQNKNII